MASEDCTPLDYAIALYTYLSIDNDPSNYCIVVVLGKKRPEDPHTVIEAAVEKTENDITSLMDAIGKWPANYMQGVAERWAATLPEGKAEVFHYQSPEDVRMMLHHKGLAPPNQLEICAAYDEMSAAWRSPPSESPV